MKKYDYREAVKASVKMWMEENHEPGASMHEEFDYDTVYDGCFIDDAVTGNGSGSYTFSRNCARENFFEDDMTDQYVSDMISEGLMTEKQLVDYLRESNWEAIDVCIRCYLLGEVVQECIDEIEF